MYSFLVSMYTYLFNMQSYHKGVEQRFKPLIPFEVSVTFEAVASFEPSLLCYFITCYIIAVCAFLVWLLKACCVGMFLWLTTL